jgi:hypothetical protein
MADCRAGFTMTSGYAAEGTNARPADRSPMRMPTNSSGHTRFGLEARLVGGGG